jgi:predicted DNA-binding WGR domain protein
VKIQLYEHDRSKSQYIVWRSWGRIGTGRGDSNESSFGSKDTAIAFFKEQFYEKTGNEWETRKTSFEKVRT